MTYTEVPPHALPATLTDRLAGLFTPDQLDQAMDRAARQARATVAVFAAAPADTWNEHCTAGECAAVEFVVEFFVPPPSLEQFHRELEAQLLRLSPDYLRGRSRGVFATCVLRQVSVGTFHQHRVAAKVCGLPPCDRRWSRDRGHVEGVLRQARTGWRES